jgi:tetratricopeptide (TPR) repeat protein
LGSGLTLPAPAHKNLAVTTSEKANAAPLASVTVRQEEVILPTYLPAAPDKNPMFLEKRVYQGSSGKVYPLPFTDRISQTKTDRKWKAIWLENEYLRVLILPEIGGRIHAIQDKTNGYEIIYNQHVIKPALVGLAGPWISGGIEFNWPQHHRPATFLPVDTEIEKHPDGSVTVWCSDHDPLSRLKGMHGVCLHPGNCRVELKVRAYNRTPFTQTFLFWANVATRVHEAYESFFPPDVYYVADHARRAMSEYPLCQGWYYGVNYGERTRNSLRPSEIPSQFAPPKELNYAPNDLSWYANIPTPCSYMCMGSNEDFFGGYDFKRQAGIVHVANHHISPGKKQWTWGNHAFGYAWDRNLTDLDDSGEFGPYIEIMAGVFTDNQPDFSFLHPGETRTWTQTWYPIQKIGPAQKANLDAALSLKILKSSARIGVCVTAPLPFARIELLNGDKTAFSREANLSPGEPFVENVEIGKNIKAKNLTLRVLASDGREIISYSPERKSGGKVPPAATEPSSPQDTPTAEELFLTGLHLEQYRHATRSPTIYWEEALQRDPLDSRCNNAMGLWHLRRGEFALAEGFFRKAIQRLTARNANPYDSEAYYNLGLCLRYQGNLTEAYGCFYKAAWNQAWVSAAHHALAELDCVNHEWTAALEHLEQSLRFNVENNRARNLKVMVLRRLGAKDKAAALLQETLALDPLDWWARWLARKPMDCDLQIGLDVAHDFARAGFYEEGIALLGAISPRVGDLPTQSLGAEPLVHYTLAWLHHKAGNNAEAGTALAKAGKLPSDYCFPARLEEIAVLEYAINVNKKDATALYYLGNLLYDRRRHSDAILLWEKSASADSKFSIVWRNLGIGYFNILRKPAKARKCYNAAFSCAPNDARLLFERDQLWKRMRESPAKRLRELEKHPELVRERDDLSVELCALYNQTGQHEKALELLMSRHFQPWEGGEGAALGQYARSHLALGRRAITNGNAPQAREHFEAALTPPLNLGEAKHFLANDSDVHLWLGRALAALGEHAKAREHWTAAANFKGDFQQMSARVFSEMTYYSALAWKELGKPAQCRKLFRELLAYAQNLEKTPAKIDYFATSLPTMLLFDDDLQLRQEIGALFLQAQAKLGLGEKRVARALLQKVLKREPSHALAADLLAETK